MHRPLFLAAVGSVAAVGGLLVASAMPAGAATSVRAETMARTIGSPTTCTANCFEDTPVTFTVSTIGTLNMTVPTPASPGIDLGGASGDTGGTTSNPLGTVTVTDTRDIDPADWTVTVSSTNFTNTTPGDGGDVIDATAASYATGGVTASAGNITDSTTGAGGLALSTTAVPAVAEANDVGDNTATWDPTVTITVPALTITGTYDGTITHSIS